MKRTLLIAALMVQVGCSSELQVLEPRASMDPPPFDAQVGVDDDAGLADGDAEPQRDAQLPARDAQFVPRDAADLRDANMVDPSQPDAASDAGAPRLGARVISAFAQTCAVIDGELSCWGDDTEGGVGVLGAAPQLVPQRIAEGTYVDVCAGERHSCALRVDGTISCWGNNARGELGVGDFQPREQPTEQSARRYRAVACGGFNTCAIAQRGELYCWGENKEGKLGQGDPPPEMPGTMPDMASAVRVDPSRSFSDVSVGQGHVCAISEGALFCWGRNNTGQVGVRETDEQFRLPTEVAAGTAFVDVGAGQRHTCAVDGEGKLLCWGENRDGLLGLSTDVPIVRTPTTVGDDSDHVQVAANWFHTCVLKKSGTLECWGRNEEGQLGLGDSMPRAMPTRVGPEFRWKSFAVGQFHTCAFDAERPWCWGENVSGQLGTGETARKYLPTQVLLP
jgi:alpha-tubulin suppressor-like RCC1 family protein